MTTGAGVALVHEWLGSRAGSERTFEQMTQVLPGADRYALTQEPGVQFDIAGAIRLTGLQRVPALRRRRALALPLMPIAWRLLSTPQYETVITSSHAFARWFPTGSAIHLCYVYTPLRYAWNPRRRRPWSGPDDGSRPCRDAWHRPCARWMASHRSR